MPTVASAALSKGQRYLDRSSAYDALGHQARYTQQALAHIGNNETLKEAVAGGGEGTYGYAGARATFKKHKRYMFHYKAIPKGKPRKHKICKY
ncbi:hypothetical protein BGZ92_004186 [Podila epicladia]|nr:hypothetical protein BGZ92_004186 [Podila epicladia]